jgi:hypothetical protein
VVINDTTWASTIHKLEAWRFWRLGRWWYEVL